MPVEVLYNATAICMIFYLFISIFLQINPFASNYLVDYLVPITLIAEHYTPITLNKYRFKTYNYDDTCQLSKIWLSSKFLNVIVILINKIRL